jgi:drug/metabolite transporter (DMT)-like permease
LTALVSGFTPAQTTAIKGVIAGSVNLALGMTIEGRVPGARALGVALLVGALSYGVSIMLYISGAQQLGATRSQLIFSTSPFMGMALAWTLLDEPAHPAQLGAAGLMAMGIYLMLTARHGPEHGHMAMSHTHSHRHDDGHHNHNGATPSPCR